MTDPIHPLQTLKFADFDLTQGLAWALPQGATVERQISNEPWEKLPPFTIPPMAREGQGTGHRYAVVTGELEWLKTPFQFYFGEEYFYVPKEVGNRIIGHEIFEKPFPGNRYYVFDFSPNFDFILELTLPFSVPHSRISKNEKLVAPGYEKFLSELLANEKLKALLGSPNNVLFEFVDNKLYIAIRMEMQNFHWRKGDDYTFTFFMEKDRLRWLMGTVFEMLSELLNIAHENRISYEETFNAVIVNKWNNPLDPESSAKPQKLFRKVALGLGLVTFLIIGSVFLLLNLM